jgi:excinuclease ABC subunit C
LNSLKEKLQLVKAPQRIEAYDISNIQGNMAVGSMVVFENGAPRPSQYRRFRIKAVQGVDDYAMMSEMLQRRFKSHAESDGDWAVTPDLIIIDGGKGHLGAALQAMQSNGKGNIPVISLAKENEEVFIPGKSTALDLDRTSPESHLLQIVRDEAHRFAITYHRKLRSTQGTASALDSIAGVGAARRKALIKRFGSVRNIKHATLEELVSVKGITTRLAERILQSLA